jgi:AcrR family transcriptional regulator
MPPVSEEHRERRRQEILDRARPCFARYGYEGATVRRLEQEIGLSRGAIFNYFPTKGHLFHALVEREYERSPDSWSEGGFEELARSIVEDDASWLLVQLQFEWLLRANPKLRAVRRKRLPADGKRRISESIVRGQRSGEFRDDVPAEALRVFLGLIADGLVVHAALGAPVDLDAVLGLVDDAVGGRTARAPRPRGAPRASGRPNRHR